ncbi:MAG: hypothetical protein H0X62_04285 [Bacteroidetes bacterium]|nr:hypothetical protein [Bacteroidota bacterium]
MILVYSHKITNRLNYIFKLVLTELVGAEIELTSDEEKFKHYQGPSISYTSQPIGDELFFLSNPLLFDHDIRDYAIEVSDWEGTKSFFPTNRVSALPFDPFAASFYLVSRYEEYLPHIKDEYGRFDSKESLAFQKEFLERPLINIWASKIKQLLAEKYPGIQLKQANYKFISTIDIDNAYAYKEKGTVRTVGGFARAVVNMNMEEAMQRLSVVFGKCPDPFDTYDYQLEVQKRFNLNVIYFMLLADYGINDNNIPVQSKKLQSLIKSLADYAEVGIHPGFNAHLNLNKLQEEHARLEHILKREVKKSRQHFLKLTLPETYRDLISLDISDDYTMGYASKIGFRASICTAFNFYDLDLDVETKLRVHPFVLTDANLKYSMKLQPENAMDYIAPIIEEVKSLNGTFISIWHNDSLSENAEWKGWREVFESLMKNASAK